MSPSPSPETCRSPKIVDRDESRRSLRVAFQYSSTANTSSSTRSTPHFASRRILNTTATGQVNISALITDSQCSRNQCFQSLDSIRSSLVFRFHVRRRLYTDQRENRRSAALGCIHFYTVFLLCSRKVLHDPAVDSVPNRQVFGQR
jgi:hypothetical protein